MAIFSQMDDKTNTDFRKYNIKKPNRNIPFQLPKSIEKKLWQFMQELELNTGSIDIVVDKSNNYYFLEVNPIGQFGMVSFPCNYLLEKKVAEHLI
jgi:D-alanine-D-alanine ligase-like ATP-grasp enzyme